MEIIAVLIGALGLLAVPGINIFTWITGILATLLFAFL